ncbi:exodeoxyribonuclease V subunit alpha [Vibrio natriegens]|uniref:RecBCD enzyme subunit RecD n=1 Tax=Vibrio natriegens NBRC 15636 = ATCC 14048 = DSM 759 TaxID=1219067 RepID=A0AAN0Y413_VIBNA|nr:exodeoxyribonuclease V subunit alpha [Vibrio natriegens]ALR14808.1 exodeoxyribonuclease V subunit alpha [Vibrio natriegens NBRC 15636 = ATCC 14048 = DSM 759]ANQ13329.1 exodeoxyribonuclease V subunit alpha [Vibrio natriegens NBRC 15636 = ATCC 14048 = DSM 759]EPM40914.1 exodeoxyribonuclease V subunit alpha [Vibrio natriegens NBRC 15636 = ATCC 14048 = DSM 759]MDX6027762.1 exodeoxyribonuclease V subunit alpha [Vibrio natriegens NBRC 15636 = ATCC 14048 = DSM 759]UUI11070.1 exodeoxyribonuclease V
MTTYNNLPSNQESLLGTLERLAHKGAIRQLDYQFARFLYAQTDGAQSESQSDGQALAFIAGVVSSELGKGHICLPLFDAQGQPTDLASKLGLFGEAALTLNTQLQGNNWPQLLENSSLVGAQGEALPLMFDGERLYLHRYWHYEVTLAEKLNQLGAAVSLQPQEFTRLSELLNHLFARQYHFLFNAIAKATEAGNNNQVLRQQLVCDHLDVVASDALDWPAIDALLSHANKVQDLQPLDDLVPLSACVNWQKVAAAVALTRRFAVISGGPGTGKTTTVTKLLAALIEQAAQEKNLTIKLVAPTGKAAARLTESIGKAVQELPVSPELKAKIPTESSTLHRLLGAIPNSAEFRHNKQNPLHLDILVIDEASMVDLPMMYKVVDALPKHARLILLGDKDQLASVEAGAVLGDICSFHALGYGKEQASAIAKLTGFDSLAHSSNSASSIADSLCMLQKSYRFDARSGIGQLAKAVNLGSAASVDNVWARDFLDIEHFALSSQNYNQMMQTLVQEYGRYLKRIGQQEQDPNTGEPETLTRKAKAVLDTFNQCRLLCAIREGDFGVAGLNQRIEKALAARKLIKVQDEIWYHGRPVMVTRNDHGLGLYNGDIGICMRDDSEEEQRLKVFFELPDGSVKSVLPSRVPEHETAYAMTIHKSQGSEFDYTLMILPPDFSPILTRELIYTGITRAKKRLALYAELNVLKRGIKVKTNRASGLVQRLAN